MQTATITTTKWEIDPLHTEVQFKVKHLVISTVTGFFKKFSGGVESEGENLRDGGASFDGARVNFSLDVSSIDTNQPDRDKHLKSADFFAADEHPTIDFSGEMKKQNDEEYSLAGDLTIRGTTKKVMLKADFGGLMVDPW